MSNYRSVSLAISQFLKNHPPDYAACVTALRQLLKTEFAALIPESNPILKEMENWGEKQLAFVIVEYSAFSNEAIHMLVDAMLRDHDWHLLRKELEHNISEEKGLMTQNIPHLEMMRQGYRLDLGLETDRVNHSSTTQSFLKKMRDIFKHDDNAFSAGALLAFEGTAIDEFKILDAFVRKYKELSGDRLIKGSLTNLYIDGHKDFEIGHEEGLKQAIAPYINSENIDRFVRGYLSVCLTMDVWWHELAIETYFRMLYRDLSVSEIEVFDVSEVFAKDSIN